MLQLLIKKSFKISVSKYCKEKNHTLPFKRTILPVGINLIENLDETLKDLSINATTSIAKKIFLVETCKLK